MAVDAYLTDELVKLVEKSLHLRQLKVHYKLLEVRIIVYLFINHLIINFLNCIYLSSFSVGIMSRHTLAYANSRINLDSQQQILVSNANQSSNR